VFFFRPNSSFSLPVPELGEASAKPTPYRCDYSPASTPSLLKLSPFSRNYSHHAGHLRIIIIHSSSVTAPAQTFLACAYLACCSAFPGAVPADSVPRKKPPKGLQRRLLVQYQYLCWGPCAASSSYPRGSGTEISDHHCHHCHQTTVQRKLQQLNGLLPKRQAIEPWASYEPQHPLLRSFLRRHGVHAF
jgi:hypothetical protein